MSRDADKRTGLETVIHNVGERVTLARLTRRMGITVTMVGIIGLILSNELWGGSGGLICSILVFIGAGGVMIGGSAARRASNEFHAALEHLEISQWLDGSGAIDLEAMLADLREKKGMEIRDGGAAYFLQRGDGSMRIAEGKGGADEWRKEKERIDAMDPRSEIDLVEIEARPAEKLVEEASMKRAEEANEAFLQAERGDVDLIEAGIERLGDDLGGPVTSSERP